MFRRSWRQTDPQASFGHDPALLAGLFDHHRRPLLRLLPPGLDGQIDDPLLSDKGGLPLVPDLDLDDLAELQELFQLGIGLGDADVADDALAHLPAFAHGFDELDGLFRVSGLSFNAEEHDADSGSLFSESLARKSRFQKYIVSRALHFPPRHHGTGIPLCATPRKTGTTLKSSQTVEVRNSANP